MGLFAASWTAVFQSPLSMGILQARILEGLPYPPPGDRPNPGSNPGLPHCRQILYCLSHQGSPRILVAYPFLRGSSWPRNQTGGLLHCRQILYQLSSYQGSPKIKQTGYWAFKCTVPTSGSELWAVWLAQQEVGEMVSIVLESLLCNILKSIFHLCMLISKCLLVSRKCAFLC